MKIILDAGFYGRILDLYTASAEDYKMNFQAIKDLAILSLMQSGSAYDACAEDICGLSAHVLRVAGISSVLESIIANNTREEMVEVIIENGFFICENADSIQLAKLFICAKVVEIM